jgi:hypothetical protein
MTNDASIPATAEAAAKAGYKKLEELPAALQREIRKHDLAQADTFVLQGNPCPTGQPGPCSTTKYPNGTKKVCYCTPANQCDDCRFLPSAGG